MKITEVKTAFKIADVEWKAENGTSLLINYLQNLKDENGNDLPQSILKQNLARVYLIVVDGEIKKIGGSQDKGGIKGTLNIYKNGGINGRPSIRSYGIWYFLFHSIVDDKSKVEIYMIYQDNFETNVKGLFGYHNIKNASINYKILEECCKQDYLLRENGNYPRWNVQERNADWPAPVKENHALMILSSTKKGVKKGRTTANR